MSGRPAVNERIAARRAEVVAARRRRTWRQAVLVTGMLLLLVGGVALERSSLVALASIEVTGTERLTRAEVVEATGVEVGTSVLRISTGAVRDRVESMPMVEQAVVVRDGPLGLVVEVTEVAPALTASYDDGDVLVAASGLVLGPGTAPGTPTVRIAGSAPAEGTDVQDEPALGTAHPVLLGLSGPIAGLVDAAEAAPGDVTLTLRGGTIVEWGDDTRGDEKERALGAVLEELDGRTVFAINVRAPAAPTVTPRPGDR